MEVLLIAVAFWLLLPPDSLWRAKRYENEYVNYAQSNLPNPKMVSLIDSVEPLADIRPILSSPTLLDYIPPFQCMSSLKCLHLSCQTQGDSTTGMCFIDH